MKYHKNLSGTDWNKLSLTEQMANIGSEVSRTVKWKSKNEEDADLSFRRTIELIDMTLSDPKNRGRLKEILRVRELFCDWYLGAGIYATSGKEWNDYFMSFAIASRLGR